MEKQLELMKMHTLPDGTQIQLLERANGCIPRTEEEKKSMIEAAAKSYGEFLTNLGFNWQADENSADTPRRVAKAWMNDLIEGCVNAPPSVTAFPNHDKYEGLVFQGNIPLVSLCSHHNLAFTGKVHIAYIPSKDGKVVGLSKLNRIADYFGRRPQLQEALTMQIHKMVDETCEKNQGVAVCVEANHTCCSNRGIRHASTMKTAELTGFFKTDIKAREEFYHHIMTL